jgi:hypothetical protein
MRVLDDPEPWVAQCLDFAQFDLHELKLLVESDTDDEHAQDDPVDDSDPDGALAVGDHDDEDHHVDHDDDEADQAECMRAAFRWLNRPQDVRAELTKVQGHPREVFMTDYIAPLHYNSIGVIDDVVVVKPSLAALQRWVPMPPSDRPVYFCTRFFWTEAAKTSPPPNNKHVKATERLRPLKTGELEMILHKPTMRNTLFWRVVNPRPAARKSFAGALARRSAAAAAPSRRSTSSGKYGDDFARLEIHEMSVCAENAAATEDAANDGGGAAAVADGDESISQGVCASVKEQQTALDAPEQHVSQEEQSMASGMASGFGSPRRGVAMAAPRPPEIIPLLCRTDDDDDVEAEREQQQQCGAPSPPVVGAKQQEALENAVDEDEALRNEARAPEAIPLAENGVLLEMLMPGADVRAVDRALLTLSPEQRMTFSTCVPDIVKQMKERLAEAMQSGFYSDAEAAKSAVVEEMSRHARKLLLLSPPPPAHATTKHAV